MASTSDHITSVNLPSDLADQIEKQAKQENRSVSELLNEAFRSYQVRKVLEESNERFRQNNLMGYTEADVERLIDEYGLKNVALPSAYDRCNRAICNLTEPLQPVTAFPALLKSQTRHGARNEVTGSY